MAREKRKTTNEPEETLNEVTEDNAGKILATIYEKALDGIPKVSRSLEEMCSDYSRNHQTPEKAAKALARTQILKCGTSGFITGLGGLITLPVAIPANIGSVLYVQMRMVAAIAKLGGYDVRSDQVQTLIYMCLTGTAISDVLKETGIQVGEKVLTTVIKKVPGSALISINKKVGFRLLTKFGEKGIVNLGKLVPVVGGVIGGGFDVASTTLIAQNAIKVFIRGENPEDYSDVSAEEIEAELVEFDTEEESGSSE